MILKVYISGDNLDAISGLIKHIDYVMLNSMLKLYAKGYNIKVDKIEYENNGNAAENRQIP